MKTTLVLKNQFRTKKNKLMTTRLKRGKGWVKDYPDFRDNTPETTLLSKRQKARGVKIGKNCHFCPYVLIDLIYPSLVKIGDYVTIGSNTMIFAHSNPTANLFLKKGKYSRKVAEVNIRTGAVINPGCIVTSGVTIGENSIISPGSVVTQDIPEYSIAVGNPARVVKKVDH